jgi:hypothetical protein
MTMEMNRAFIYKVPPRIGCDGLTA